MKQLSVKSLFILALSVLLVACNPTASEPSAVDVEATVVASVAATAQAEAALELAIETAVDEAVNEAVDVAVDAAVEEAIAAATPAAEYVALTEEELAILIDDSVDEAVAATESYAQATTAATSDGTVTTEEVQTIEYYVAVSEETLADIDAMIETYYALYGGTGDEIVAELVAIEEELADLNQNVTEMNGTLSEINETLEQGLALAEETIDQLEQVAQEAQTTAQAAAVQAQGWVADVQGSVSGSVDEWAEVLAGLEVTAVAANQEEMLSQVFGYVDTVNNAMGDDALSSTELMAIAQQGVNTQASLAAQGGPQLAGLSGNIEGLTRQLTQGDMQGARTSMERLQGQLPQRPAGLGGGGGRPKARG